MFKSLALRTDLIFHRFAGEVIERGDYVVIRTPAQPDYIWGNCLILRAAPARGSAAHWLSVLEREIGRRAETGFAAITWDDPSGSAGDVAPFLTAGLGLATHDILTATDVQKPSGDRGFAVRPLVSDGDWEQHIAVQTSEDWGYGSRESQRRFAAKRGQRLRAMGAAGLGMRFGAFAGERLAADLGIYWDGLTARFNGVVTDAAMRRQGACRALVAEAAHHVLAARPGTMLVLEADPESSAARIYAALGFRKAEQVCRLEWFGGWKPTSGP